VTADNCMTVTDSHGASIVLERDPEDGVVAVWIAPPGENDGYSVFLGKGSRELIAKFLDVGAA
jgi:hypothetical protein